MHGKVEGEADGTALRNGVSTCCFHRPGRERDAGLCRPFLSLDTSHYPFLLMPLLLTTRAREGRCGKVWHHAMLASD